MPTDKKNRTLNSFTGNERDIFAHRLCGIIPERIKKGNLEEHSNNVYKKGVVLWKSIKIFKKSNSVLKSKFN